MKNGEQTQAEEPLPGLPAASPPGHPGRTGIVRACAAAAVTLVVLGACSGSMTKQLDTDKGEDLIRTHLQGKVDGPVEEVSCAEREVKQGDVSECTARVDGQPLRLRITQDDDKGNVSIMPVQAILDVKQAVALIEQEVAKAKRVPVQADCGTQRYLVRDPGTTFDCGVTAKTGRTSSRVIVTVKDVAGNVDLRIN